MWHQRLSIKQPELVTLVMIPLLSSLRSRRIKGGGREGGNREEIKGRRKRAEGDRPFLRPFFPPNFLPPPFILLPISFLPPLCACDAGYLLIPTIPLACNLTLIGAY